MATPNWILVIVILTTVISSVLTQCPKVCQCQGTKVECKFSTLTKIPDGIPTTVTSLSIDATSPVDRNFFGELARGNFSSFKQLESIVLSRCGVTGIAVGTFSELTKLKSLTLEYNAMASLYPGSFLFAQRLTSLKLSLNGLKRLEDYTFRGLETDALDLSGNDIGFIEDQTFFQASLKSFNLSQNDLTSLNSAVLRPLADSLTKLDLRRNKMKSLDADLLTSLTNLVEINLSWNMIHEISPAMLATLTNLKVLNMEHNALTGLREGFLAIIDRVDSIKVDNNPFSCNCDLKWLKTFAQPNQTCPQKKKCFTAVRCVTPKDLPLQDFPEDDFECTAVKIVSTTLRLAEASCRAKGDPAPTIWWKAPSGAVVSAATESYGVTETNSTIKITLDSAIGDYQCIAGNRLGNKSAIVKDVGTCRSRNVSYGPGDIAGAVLGTFCFCVILAALLWIFKDKICKKKDGRKKPVPKFKNNVYRDITSPLRKTGETERM